MTFLRRKRSILFVAALVVLVAALVNAQATKLTHGRTRRVLLHSLDKAPHTGCGCYRLIMFKTDEPRPGVGIMDPSYEGCAPDGRRWKDLYYDLAGKQCPGVAGCSPSYLSSRKFLRAHGGWGAVVWVSPKVAEMASAQLSEDVEVG